MSTSAPPNLRILFFCTGRIDRPRSGGELRIHHLCRELAAQGHHVEVRSFGVRNHPALDAWPAERFHVRLSHSLWLDLAAVADRLRLIPITELPVWLTPLRGFARRIARRGAYDIVHCELPWFAALEGAIPAPARVVYGAQNVEWIWWGPTLLRRPCGRWWRGRLRDHERSAVAHARGIVACTARDGRWLGRQRSEPAQQIAIIPNGFDARQFRPPTAGERSALRQRFGFGPGEKVALFVASDTAPNRQAARLLLESARAPLGALRLVLAGRVCESLGNLPLPPGARLLGPVVDVLPLMQAADAGLNPMLAGSGSNLKLIEYCAAGLPVVTTPFGLRGFEELQAWLTVRPAENCLAAAAETTWPGTVPPEKLQPFAWESLARRLADFYRTIARS